MAQVSKLNLENLPEWQLIEYHANQLITDYTNELIVMAERGETAQMCERAGRIAGIKELLAYPETFVGGQYAKKSDNETD